MKVLALLGALVALTFTGCVEDNPCQYLMPAGKALLVMDEDDGKVVEVDGQEAVCEDGEAVVR